MTETSPPPSTSLRARLQAALTEAMRGRDLAAASALRSALGALGNAEAVPAASAGPPGNPAVASPHIAGAASGVGAAEAARRSLSAAGAEAIVAAEIAERQSAADDYERHGHSDRAGKLRHEADVLRAVLETGPAAGTG